MTPIAFLKLQSKSGQRWIRLKIAAALAGLVFFIIQAYCLADIVNRVYIHKAPLSNVFYLMGLISVCILARAFFAYYKEKFGFIAANNIKQSLRSNCFKHILEEGAAIHQHYQAAELSTLLVEQIEASTDYYAQYLPQIMLVVLIPLLILVVIYPLNWVAGTLLLITAPLIPLFMALVGLGAKAANEKNFKALSRLGNQFLDLM
ncbi:MAG: cysteine/glutathione ABC transporter permease/ATP-binding protein CydD, partial [Gammaproteobacteria bacterium]|nr:cysteine/glutathione ABC transporter permease/ATP-binding protein CydD [Gammaproteobacteria bacterium]